MSSDQNVYVFADLDYLYFFTLNNLFFYQNNGWKFYLYCLPYACEQSEKLLIQWMQLFFYNTFSMLNSNFNSLWRLFICFDALLLSLCNLVIRSMPFSINHKCIIPVKISFWSFYNVVLARFQARLVLIRLLFEMHVFFITICFLKESNL